MKTRRWFTAVLFMAASHAFGADVPARPLGFVHDPASVLPLTLSKSLGRVLEEHASLTRESVFVVVSPEKKEDEDARAAEIFESWKRDTQDPTSAVLIYFQLGERKVALHAGVGMESFLSQFPLERVTREVLRNELSFQAAEKAGGNARSRAIILSVIEVLKRLESPTVDGNKAQEILREGGFSGPFIPRKPEPKLPLWPVALMVGLLGFAWIMNVALSGEAHYSGEGWVRVKTWVPRWISRLGRRNRAPKLVTGGGVSGNF